MWPRLKPVYALCMIFITAITLIIVDLKTNKHRKYSSYYGNFKFKPLTTKYLYNKLLSGPIMNNNMLGNYEDIEVRKDNLGLGDYGVAVNLDENHKLRSQESVSEYGFNIYVSDMISLDRKIKDTRPSECKHWQYPSVEKLPSVSVIIVYFNEGWSVIARTIHSVINTSPKELLHEIILVDDGSTYNLHDNLTNYGQTKWRAGLIKTMRNSIRLGLIRARVQGAEMAAGDIIVILDAHCECVTNWLPPLVMEIALNRKTLAVPIVDGIDHFTLEHRTVYNPNLRYTGIWEWGFLYKETSIPKAEADKHKYVSEPYWSPTHAGGLLAIDRNWFFEIGAYDDGIKIWGGEQYELSFKVWLCGGVLKWVPCSHVAHIYRGPRKSNFPNPLAQSHQTDRNHLRLSAIWMDEYQKYYRTREPATTKLSFGSIDDQLAMKKRLQCKSFDWFMKNVAYVMFEKYPVPSDNVVWGNLRNKKYPVCMDQMGAGFGDAVKVSKYCGQWFRLNTEGELSTGEYCFRTKGKPIIKYHCLEDGGWIPKGEWTYLESEMQMKSKTANKCLDTDGIDLFMSDCDTESDSRKWTWYEMYYS